MKPPPWYVWLALVVSTVASVALNVIVSVQLAERTVQQQQDTEREAAEAGRLATCGVVRTQLAIYDTAPPSTATGKEAVRAWGEMASLYRCR